MAKKTSKSGKLVSVTVLLPADHIKKIKARSEETSVSMSDVIRMLIGFAFDRGF